MKDAMTDAKRAVRTSIALLSAAIILGTFTTMALAQEGLDTLIRAARSMTFSVQGNSAFILEKQETIPSAVAVIFGYGDNRTACESIAEILTASRRQGSFKCHSVY
jgi:hypothetical protein